MRNGSGGGYNAAGAPDIYGQVTARHGSFFVDASGTFLSSAPTSTLNLSYITDGIPYDAVLKFQAARWNAVYGNSATIMPESVNVSVGLYLGRPSEI